MKFNQKLEWTTNEMNTGFSVTCRRSYNDVITHSMYVQDKGRDVSTTDTLDKPIGCLRYHKERGYFDQHRLLRSIADLYVCESAQTKKRPKTLASTVVLHVSVPTFSTNFPLVLKCSRHTHTHRCGE